MARLHASRRARVRRSQRSEAQLRLVRDATLPSPYLALIQTMTRFCRTDRSLSTRRRAAETSLAELTKGTRVTVNAVLPGSTKTEGVMKFIREVFPGLSPEEAERRFMRENRPTSLIERLIDPAEVGDFVAYLCSPRSSAVNGAALRVDGGLVRSIC